MGLSNGYGVLVGTRERYYRDPVNDYGQYFHANLLVGTPSGSFHCAIDVDSHQVPNGVQWRVVSLCPSALKGVDALGEGWHLLASDPVSGALDVIRNRRLRLRLPARCARLLPALPFPWPRLPLPPRLPFLELPWKSGVSTDALADLEPLVARARKVLVFGEPFSDGGLGVHNIHQNQGDPLGSQFAAENGIWQDGATIIQLEDGCWRGFFNKFSTQADRTDGNGRPLP